MLSRRWSNPVLLLAIFLLAAVLLSRNHLPAIQYPAFLPAQRLGAANATLGFGGIYVVSGLNSPRRSHLEDAAAVSELKLTIPEQVSWTDEDIWKFQIADHDNSKVGKGSVKAWLSHHLVLRAFLDSGEETALIMEDDVDWDIRLRTEQIPVAQNAARTLMGNKPLSKTEYPWGSPADWDLLYIGHCGDYFGPLDKGVGVGHHHPEQLDKILHVLAPDRSMLYRTDLHPFTASLLTAFRIPEQTRLFHKSQWPLCTFGYAITRDSAKQVMEQIAPGKEDTERHLTAYDAAILAGCRDGDMRCYTLQPELFHHMDGQSLIAVAEKDHGETHRPPVDVAGLEQVRYRGETSNIGCGFWSGEFYFSGDSNSNKFSSLLEEVGRKGRCLKNKYADQNGRGPI